MNVFMIDFQEEYILISEEFLTLAFELRNHMTPIKDPIGWRSCDQLLIVFSDSTSPPNYVLTSCAIKQEELEVYT